ncbi:hypothetical protein GCM10011390_45960 [Aureimonas endophytica]|uniref:YD repeat-containing protein n=2 Tax=Aureimonas endophytica TaxID=2027858 RepID=A0A917EBK6_9HYPH|nr:hypothetical protein GCM10011390_45960 [Aureimonas endophytica]
MMGSPPNIPTLVLRSASLSGKFDGEFHLAGTALPGQSVGLLLEASATGADYAWKTVTADATGHYDGVLQGFQLGLGKSFEELDFVALTGESEEFVSNDVLVAMGTGSGIKAHLAHYAGNTQLGAILFTGSANLTFGSKAELDRTRVAYADVLGKIVGNYTLTVATADLKERHTDVYDKAGQLTKATTVDVASGAITALAYDAKGALSHKTYRHDGVREETDYAIANKPYASQHAVYDAKGHILSAERHYADGTLAFTQLVKADGSSEVHSYDKAGRESVKIAGDLSGERDVFEFSYAGAANTASTTTRTHYGVDNAKQWIDQTAADGSHVQTAKAAGVVLASHAGVADTLVAFNGGSDHFVFGAGFGKDKVIGFEAQRDVLVFDEDLASSFASLQSHVTQTGSGTLISFGADTILLKGIAAASLTAENVHFAAHDLLLV